MYDDIFGVSETWLSLVSQTTRLANKMDAVKGNEHANDTLFRLLQRRAARLEDMVCSFTARFVPRSTAEKFAANNFMHKALNSGLVIFFYRRIRDVNPWILQSHVDDVISALELFDQALSNKTWEGPGTPWPAFMAGCEAVAPEKRDKLMSWIERAASITGFDCYEKARELLLAVWQMRDGMSEGRLRAPQRSHPASTSISWVEVCREQKAWLMAF
jgi:arginine metabolism regulation protein II